MPLTRPAYWNKLENVVFSRLTAVYNSFYESGMGEQFRLRLPYLKNNEFTNLSAEPAGKSEEYSYEFEEKTW